ncbi:P-loop NTPase fold protein [Sinorhizobium fredii]|uniref:P-loop NTPase fold protein n=1 Tax=Rhizobium fredii TaxID=380 RepID=UPI000CF2DF44|nr:P-loop NTPase fold protein [Sinorhizobium fredii]
MSTATADHWVNDRLGRKNDAEFLYNFLVGQYQKRLADGRTASYVLNVDSEWGGGKTFFLEGLAADIKSRGHLVASINAWRDDHAQDPYVAIMAAIDDAFAPYIRDPGRVRKA